MKRVSSVIVTALAAVAFAGMAFAAEPPSTTAHSPNVETDATMTGGSDAGANPVGEKSTKKKKKHAKKSKKSKKSGQDVTGTTGTGTGHGMGTGGTGGEMSGSDASGNQTPAVQPSPSKPGY